MANDEYVDGIKDLGKDRTGRRWWHARLYWTDPLTGSPRETKRKYHAASRGLALQRRDELTEELRTGGSEKLEHKRFEEVSTEWLGTITVHSTKLSSESHARKLNDAFGTHWVHAITTAHLQEFFDTLAVTPASANNVRNAMIRIWDHAVGKRYCKANVARAVKRRDGSSEAVTATGEGDEDPEDVEQANQALDPEQVAALLDDLEIYEPDLYPMVFTQYMLGCRFAEVSALQRKRVDLVTGIVKILRGQYRGVVGRTKGKKARRVPLPVEAHAMLRKHLERMEIEQPPGWEDLVFPRPMTGYRRSHNFWFHQKASEALHRSFKRTGIVVKGSTHVARHTMITVANDVAPSEALIRKVVGHRSQKVHDSYNHPGDAKLVSLGERVGAALLSKRKRALEPDQECVQGSGPESMPPEAFPGE